MMAVIVKLILLFLAAAAISLIVDNRRFVKRRYTIRSPRIRKPVKIVFIADLHEKCYGNDNEKVVEAIREEKPDVILVGGDLIVSAKVAELHNKSVKDGGAGPEASDGAAWMKRSLSLMKRLTGIAPVYFVQGNHELRLAYYDELQEYDRKFRQEMERAGVRFLHNGSADPLADREESGESGVLLRGLELPMDYYKKFKRTPLRQEELKKMLGEADRGSYTVLMSHIPVYFRQYAEWGADLSLCGHTHGGLMRLPVIGGVMGTRPNLFPKYSGGQYFCAAKTKEENHLSCMILTCGLGMHTLPIRIFNPGEISVIRLIPAGSTRQEEA